MSWARNTALAVGLTLAAWGGVLAYRSMGRDDRPASPVAAESAQEKADKVQAAFARGAEVDDAEVEAFVARLQAAVRERDTQQIAGMVAPSRLLDGVEAATGRSLSPATRGAFEAQLASRLVEVFDDTVVETHVKRIDRDAQGNIVVYLRMIDVDRITSKARWWLYHDGEGLRWWDAEDLQLGLRIGTMMGAGIAAATSPGSSQAIEQFGTVIAGLAELSMDDRDQVQRMAMSLDGLELQGLPASFRHLAIVMRATCAVALGEPEDALRRLDALESEPLEPIEPLDMPMRHFLRASASLSLERWSDAAQASERFLELLGEDAEAYTLLGEAKLGLGDTQAAMAAFDQGIADDPRLPDNYGGAVMTAADVPAAVERLRKAPDDAVLDGAAQWLVDAEDGEGLDRLLTAAAQARPSWNATPWTGKAALLRALSAGP